jgi:hypothetical protein
MGTNMDLTGLGDSAFFYRSMDVAFVVIKYKQFMITLNGDLQCRPSNGGSCAASMDDKATLLAIAKTLLSRL